MPRSSELASTGSSWKLGQFSTMEITQKSKKCKKKVAGWFIMVYWVCGFNSSYSKLKFGSFGENRSACLFRPISNKIELF